MLENEPYPYDRRVAQIAKALTEAGYRVTVASPMGHGFGEADEEIDGVRVRRYRALPEGGGPAGYVREYLAAYSRLRATVATVVRDEPPDVVIACNPPDFLLATARRATRRGAKTIFDHHDLSPELFESKFGRRGPLHAVLRAIERWTFRHADAVMSTNDSYADVARARGGVAPDRVFVVRNGPDPGRLYPVEADPGLRRGRKHLVLWLGRMSIQDGVDTAVAVAEELVNGRGRRDISFAFVGPGDARDAVVASVERQGLAEYVDLPGQVGDEDVRRYLSTADVCLSVDPPNPLNESSTMIKVLEYMYLSRPVVQTPLPEMQRLCGDATHYAPADDVSTFATRVEGLLDDPELAEALGRAARDRITEQGLTWPDQIPTLLQAVSAVLGPQDALAAGR